MKFQFNLFPLLATSLLTFQGVSAYDKFIPAADREKAVPGEWIVVMKGEKGKGADGASFLASDAIETFDAQAVNTFVNSFNLSSKKMKVKSVYSNSMHGFAVSGLKVKDAKKFSMDSRVKFVEQNAKVSINDYQWGLDRVDQRDLPLDESFEPLNELDGTGITAYVIDTGIRITHEEFGGRARWGVNESGDSKSFDCNGHGTHVAGSVGGEKYGVANNVTLVAVKVLDCQGDGTYEGVIKGIEWTLSDAKDNVAPGKATANLSLGGPKSQAVDTAVRNLHASGVPTIVAAGNSNTNACNASPARERSIITVGSTDIDDKRSSFSNYGECVDIFAPGRDIKASWIDNDSQTKTISGTSMASPHVCGAVALLLQSGTPPGEIDEKIISTATDDKVTDAGSGSPNKLLFIGKNRPTNPPTKAPPTAAPTPCADSSIQISLTTDEYPDETSIDLKNECDGSTVLERAPGYFEDEATTYVEDLCLPAGKYIFTIHDSWDDGICCSFDENGSYTVSYNDQKVAEGGEFETEESTVFGSCGSTSDPPAGDDDDDDEENWSEIFKEDFENAQGHVRGSVSTRLYHNGKKSLRLVGKKPRFNEAYTGNIHEKIKGYNNAKVEFYAQTKGLNDGDGIRLYAIIGQGRKAKKVEVAEWIVGEEISENNQWVALEAMISIDNQDNLSVKLEFTLTNPQARNTIGAYLDDLTFSGATSSLTGVPISSPPSSASEPVIDMINFEDSEVANAIFVRPRIENLKDGEGNNIKVARITKKQTLASKGWIEDITSDELKLDFSFYFDGKALGDDLEIQFRFKGNIGKPTEWKTVKKWTLNDEFTNNEWYNGSITVATDGNHSFKFRFLAVQQAREFVYFDDISLSSLN